MNLELESHLQAYFERSDIRLIGDPLKEKAKVIVKDNSFFVGPCGIFELFECVAKNIKKIY